MRSGLMQRLKERRPRGRPRHEDILTPREWQVFELLEAGLTNKQIATRMGISENGAKYHVAEILSKLGVTTRHAAVEQMQARPEARLGIAAWLGSLGWNTPAKALRTATAAVLLVGLLTLGGFGVLLAVQRWPNGTNDGTGIAQGSEDLSAALADFTGNPGNGLPVRLDDPIAYCQAVGTIDTPDARYTGPVNPGWLAPAFARAAGIPADSGIVEHAPALVWRCADGRVLACSHGANIPCESKANTSNKPSKAMTDYCANPPATPAPGMPSFIPAYVTGHDTIYSWACEDGRAVTNGPQAEVDNQGYMARFWYQVAP